MIVLHRRGTTGEWQQADLLATQLTEVLLKDGEFAIEEREDGSRWVKIGDGKTKFAKLPYIDERAVSQLSAKLSTVEAGLQKKITELDIAQKSQLLIAKQELANQISSSVSSLTTAFEAQDVVVLEEAKQHISTEADSIRSELTKDYTNVVSIINTDIRPSINGLDKKLSNCSTTLTAATNKNNTAIAELAKTVEDYRASDKIQLDAHFTEVSNTIEQKATELTADFTKCITSSETSLEGLIEQADRKQTNALSTAKSTLEKRLSEDSKTHAANLAILKADLEALDIKTDTLLNSHVSQSEKRFSEVINQLTSLKEKAQELNQADKSLTGLIREVDITVTTITNRLGNELSALTLKQDTDNVTLLNELRNSNEARINADSDIIATLANHITNIYIELTDLVDDDIQILEKAFSVENKLLARIRKLEENAVDNLEQLVDTKILEASTKISANVEDLRSNTNLAFSSVQDNLDKFSTYISEIQSGVDGQLSELAADVETNKTEATTAIESLEEQLASASSRIDETNLELTNQSKRISNLAKLEQGSTTGDAELADIRLGYNGVDHASAGDAVRAIGNDLEDLKNSLPSYIPSNAVDGLLYEGNQLWLTSKDVPVGDPVTITGGGGGGGSISTVKVTNNLPSASFTISKGDDAWIDFIYTSYENAVATGDGTFVIIVNDKKIDALAGTVQHGVAKRVNVAEYLKNGSNTVKVTCADQYGSSRTLVYTISQIELRIESTFNSAQIFNDTITFRYKVFGQIEKTAYILVDGNEVSKKTLGASVSGNEITLRIPKQAHGCHKITAYVSAMVGDDTVPSNILEYEIICIEADDNTAIIASVYGVEKATQGDLISIPYMVYDPVHINSDIELTVYSQVAGELTEIDRTPITVDRSQQFWNTRKYPNGIAVFEISYTYNLYGTQTTVTKSHSVEVSELDADVSPEKDDLQLYLTAQGRSNNEQNPGVWTYTQAPDGDKTYDTITTTFTGFNWKSNGWITDTVGDTCLRLNGDAKAVINFKPFAEDFKANGKTIEFEFVVRDVNDRDAIVIDCFDGDRGFRATPDTAFLKSSGTEVSCRYKDEERVRVAITVEHADTTSRFVSIYLDGVLSGVQRYADTDSFQQDTQKLAITLGSSLCGLDLYNIRIYNKALDTATVLKNYIADQTVPSTRLKLMTDNDILDENGNVSYERVKALGQIPIITFTGPMPTYKGDKKKKTTRMKFEDPAHPEMNFDVLLDQIDVQGTSSQFYIRKNWKVKLPEARAHMPGSIPAKVFCIKVDYAEATGTHNTGAANFVETLYDREEVTLPPQKDDTRVRTTIQGFPIIIFEKETEDSEPVFSSKGNFNYDKDAENAFGFTEAYKDFGVECWEFCNNTSDPVNFAGEITADWLDDFEPRYVPESANFARIEELKEIEELAASGKGIMTEAQRNELAILMRKCITNFKEMHDWVLSTATYTLIDGRRVPITHMALAEPVTYGETTYIEDNEEYRLAKFKYEFKNYFNMHYSSMYYVFTFFALMTDQRAKNMFLTRWKDSDGIHRWYPYFYDNDTIFGINNEGALVFDYFHEDTDQLGSSNVFNGQNSVLWNNFRLCFPQEIQATYAKLRSDKKLTYNMIIKQFVTEGSDKWSAAIYNADADYKYVSMAREHVAHKDEDGNEVTGIDASNLYQVRGPGEHHLRYFIDNRINYCDSKWYAGDYPSDDIFLRIYTPKPADNATQEEIDRINASLAVVPANPNITITPFSAMYAGVRYKSGTLQQKLLKAGEEYTFKPLNENETFGDTETAIYGAGEISSLGDLSGLYCGVINLSNAAKLTELTVGNPDPAYYNDNFREISVGSNRLLRSIDLRNCSGLGIAGENPQKTLELSGCPNIEHIYVEGTNLTSVALPESGYIKILHLPTSIDTIVIKNQHHLYPQRGTPGSEDFVDGFFVEGYQNVRTLCIENCPNLNTNEILEHCRDENGKYTVERVRLTGIEWGTAEEPLENADFIKSLFPVFDAEGKIISGIRGIDEKNTPLDDAYLVGTCYIAKLSGEDYTEIKSHYHYLDIKYGEMTSNITFKYTDEAGIEREEVLQVTSTNSEPGNVSNFKPEYSPVFPQPKASEDDAFTYENAAFTYEFIGWSRKQQISKGIEDTEEDYKEYLQADALTGITGNRVLYPVFKAVKKRYTVTFKNLTAPTDEQVLYITEVPYNENAVYPHDDPIKQNSQAPGMYYFNGWLPSPEKITTHTTCFAQFTIDYKELEDADGTNDWYVIGLTDLTDFADQSGTIWKGYTVDANGNFIIRHCENDQNPAVLIPDALSSEDNLTNYPVTYVGGFSNLDGIELIRLPSTLKVLSARAFEDCNGLVEVHLPESLTEIGHNAFHSCLKLNNIVIPKAVSSIGYAAFAECPSLNNLVVAAENNNFKMVDGCLINTNEKSLIQALSNAEIPQDGSVISLKEYCCAGVRVTEVKIPNSVSLVPQFAFKGCSELKNLILPDSLIILDSSSFSGCSSLSTIKLPSSLSTLKSSVFYSCAFETLEIPSSVLNIGATAFGSLSKLQMVYFNTQPENFANLSIDQSAFSGSGSEDKTLHFYLPWTAAQHKEKWGENTAWGAKNYELHFEEES